MGRVPFFNALFSWVSTKKSGCLEPMQKIERMQESKGLSGNVKR